MSRAACGRKLRGARTSRERGRDFGGAKQDAEKLESAVILSIDSRSAARDRQKLGPRKGSAELFFRSAAFTCPSGMSRGPKKQVYTSLSFFFINIVERRKT